MTNREKIESLYDSEVDLNACPFACECNECRYVQECNQQYPCNFWDLEYQERSFKR